MKNIFEQLRAIQGSYISGEGTLLYEFGLSCGFRRRECEVWQMDCSRYRISPSWRQVPQEFLDGFADGYAGHQLQQLGMLSQPGRSSAELLAIVENRHVQNRSDVFPGSQ